MKEPKICQIRNADVGAYVRRNLYASLRRHDKEVALIVFTIALALGLALLFSRLP